MQKSDVNNISALWWHNYTTVSNIKYMLQTTNTKRQKIDIIGLSILNTIRTENIVLKGSLHRKRKKVVVRQSYYLSIIIANF